MSNVRTIRIAQRRREWLRFRRACPIRSAAGKVPFKEEWGPDQLGDEVVEKGASFDLQSIPKGKYDVMFVDEEGSKCDVREVDFTASETFVMTKSLMKGCQKGTDQSEDEEE